MQRRSYLYNIGIVCFLLLTTLISGGQLTRQWEWFAQLTAWLPPKDNSVGSGVISVVLLVFSLTAFIVAPVRDHNHEVDRIAARSKRLEHLTELTHIANTNGYKETVSAVLDLIDKPHTNEEDMALIARAFLEAAERRHRTGDENDRIRRDQLVQAYLKRVIATQAGYGPLVHESQWEIVKPMVHLHYDLLLKNLHLPWARQLVDRIVTGKI